MRYRINKQAHYLLADVVQGDCEKCWSIDEVAPGDEREDDFPSFKAALDWLFSSDCKEVT